MVKFTQWVNNRIASQAEIISRAALNRLAKATKLVTSIPLVEEFEKDLEIFPIGRLEVCSFKNGTKKSLTLEIRIHIAGLQHPGNRVRSRHISLKKGTGGDQEHAQRSGEEESAAAAKPKAFHKRTHLVFNSLK